MENDESMTAWLASLARGSRAQANKPGLPRDTLPVAAQGARGRMGGWRDCAAWKGEGCEVFFQI